MNEIELDYDRIELELTGLYRIELNWTDLQWLKTQAVPDNHQKGKEKSYNFPHSESRLEGVKENILFLNHKIWPQATCV